MTHVRWAASIEVDGLFTAAVAQPTIDVEAVDRVVVTVEGSATAHKVEIQPGEAGALKLIMIRASAYDPALTYKIKADASAVPLSGPQLISGGATALFDGALNTLLFANPGTEPVEVEILVARDATTA